MLGSFISGVVSDKFGRKTMLVFGLVASALSSLVMGLVGDLRIFYIGAGLVGLFGSSGEPAQQVMIADLVPENQHTRGYGVWRVATNLSLTIGPMLGGLLASSSFLWLFIGDAVFSLITAAIVLWLLPETKPDTSQADSEEEFQQAFRGYRRVFTDTLFVVYLLISILLNVVAVQLDSSLSVYLRDIHNISPEQYGYILGLNAGMVVFLQLWVTQYVSSYSPLAMMAFGAFFYSVGFSLYGFVSGLPLFFLAIAIITIGEMIIAPIAQALVVRFAPVDMRGRYMASFGLSWLIPYAAGPYLAGIILDNYNPNWVWYLAGLFSLIAAAGYFLLGLKTKKRFADVVTS
jgi:MFS family permease